MINRKSVFLVSILFLAIFSQSSNLLALKVIKRRKPTIVSAANIKKVQATINRLDDENYNLRQEVENLNEEIRGQRLRQEPTIDPEEREARSEELKKISAKLTELHESFTTMKNENNKLEDEITKKAKEIRLLKKREESNI